MSEKPTYEELENRIRQLEKTIQDQEDRDALFHGLFENMTSGSGIYQVINDGSKGSDYIIMEFNHTSLKLEGKTADQVTGKSLFDLRPNIDEYGLIPVMKKVWETGVPEYFPVKMYQDENFSNYYENYIFKIPSGEVVTIYNDVTDQKNAEQQLHESKERFELAMQFSNDGIFDWNLETNRFYYSPGWKKMLGYDDHEIKNEFSEWERLTHPDDVRVSWQMLNELLEKKRSRFEVEFRMRHKNGHWVEILSRANAVFDKTGKGIRVVGTHVDITERKQIEGLLYAQHRLSMELSNVKNLHKGLEISLNAALRISEMDCGGIYIVDADSGELNLIFQKGLPAAFVEKAGSYPPDSANTRIVMMGKPIYSKQQELDIPLSESEIQEKLKAIAVVPLLYQDQVVGCLNVASHSYNEVPVVSRVALESISRQIGRAIIQLKTEETLRENEEKYRVLFKSSSDAIFLVDVESLNIMDANEAAIRLYGYTYDELLGLKAIDISADPSKTRQCLQKKSPALISVRHHRKQDGLLFPVEIASNYFELNGRKIAINNIRDISDRIESEKIRKTLEAQLRQSQKMESIGNLAGGIAHDFNNILSSVIGFTELAIDDATKGTSLEDSLQEVYTAGKRAKDLVKQILVFARQSDEEIKPIQPSTIAKEVINFIRSSIPTTVEIKQDIKTNSLIMGNSTQIHQVLMNLCTNAAHAMEAEGGILDVSLKDITVDETTKRGKLDLKFGDYIELKVTDTGTGIAPEIVESIFEPYFTTKAIGEGTGMGLAMVHGIIESYAGKITVDSTPREGSSFSIYLPRIKKQGVHQHYVEEKLPSGTEQILFVDDEHAITKMGSQILERLGYQVTVRTSSVEALELFRTKPDDFDLVITDMTMPNMTGDKLALELMRIRPDIPVVLCTGYSKKISDEIATKIGIKGFAYKPVVKSDLAKTVRKVLDEAKK